MERIERTKNLSFRGNEFIVSVRADGSHLWMSTEEKLSGRTWLGDFSCQYIEEITHKTGNFKKFPVFMKMLMTAVDNSSESVFIDLLTYQDLEVLKSRKGAKPSVSSSSSNPKLMQKRYLILTYAVEFDRVHYPLPLVLDESPDPQAMQRTIDRLSGEIDVLRKVGPDASHLLQENEELRQQIRKLEHNQNLAAVPRKSAVEIDSLIHDKKALEEENERLRLEHVKEQKKLLNENSQLKNDLTRLKSEMDSIIDQLEAESEERAHVKEMRNKINELTKQIENSKAAEVKSKTAQEEAKTQIEQLKQNDRKQKQRIKQLEDELQTALKTRGSRTNSPATRGRAQPVRSPSIRSPANNRSPARLGTPPSRNSSANTKGSTRPGSDKRPWRQSPGSRPALNRNPSPGSRPGLNRNPSPGSRSSINRNGSPGSAYRGRNSSPGSRQNTPPGQNRRVSPQNRRPSPNNRTSPGNSTDQRNIRKKSPQTGNFDINAIDDRLARLQQLLKYARS